MTENTPSDAMVEAMARALAKADNIEICSDAQYRHSSYGIRAQAAAAVIAEAMAAKDAELAELRAKVEKAERLVGEIYEAILLESGDAHDYENL